MGVLQTPHGRGKQTSLGTAVLDSFSCLSAFRTLAKSNVGPLQLFHCAANWRVEGRPGCQISITYRGEPKWVPSEVKEEPKTGPLPARSGISQPEFRPNSPSGQVILCLYGHLAFSALRFKTVGHLRSGVRKILECMPATKFNI